VLHCAVGTELASVGRYFVSKMFDWKCIGWGMRGLYVESLTFCRLRLYCLASKWIADGDDITKFRNAWKNHGDDESLKILIYLEFFVFIFTCFFFCYWYVRGARCGAVGWGTALEAERSRVRFAMLSLEFFIDIMALGSAQPLTEMSTKNISWGVKAAGAYGWQPYHRHVPIV
jgi:hypothetical protein